MLLVNPLVFVMPLFFRDPELALQTPKPEKIPPHKRAHDSKVAFGGPVKVTQKLLESEST